MTQLEVLVSSMTVGDLVRHLGVSVSELVEKLGSGGKRSYGPAISDALATIDPRADKKTGKKTGKKTEKKTEKKTGKAAREDVLHVLKGGPQGSAAIAKMLGTNVKQTRSVLTKLKEEGLVSSSGNTKATIYTLDVG